MKNQRGRVIKYPPQVVDHEVEHVMEDLKSRLVEQNIDWQPNLKSREMDEKSSLLRKRDLSRSNGFERSLSSWMK